MEDDRAFYERRLREELARAETDADEGVRTLHRRWAALYGERLAELRSELRVPQPSVARAANPEHRGER